MDDELRTEPATPRRREDARREGRSVRSTDLTAALGLFAAVLGLHLTAGSLVSGFGSGMKGSLERLAGVTGDPSQLAGEFLAVAAAFGGAVLPLVVGILATTVGVHVLQGGVTIVPVEAKAERLNPAEGFRKIFSMRTLVRVIGSGLKITAVAAVLAVTLWEHRALLFAATDPASLGAVFGGIAFTLGIRTALVLFALAVLDWAYQRFQFEKDLRMSRQELQEELRRYEGNPAIRDQRKALMRQLVLQGMLRGMGQATVLVVDPAGCVVALRHDRDTESTPVVVAKGRGALAGKIREAGTHLIVIERPETARELFRTGEVGEPVPAALYARVADVLAEVYLVETV